MITNIQPIEWILLLFTLVGLSANVIRLMRVMREQERFRKEKINGMYGFHIKMNAIDEWLRLVKHIFLMVATIVFMLASMKRVGPMPPEGFVGRAFLAGLSSLLTVKSQINDWAERKEREMDKQQQRRKGD